MLEAFEANFLIFAYPLVFFGALLESIVFTGIFLPGSVFVLLGGFYAQKGEVSLLTVMFFGFLGMFLGDVLNFYLGKTQFLKKFSHKIPGLNTPKRREQLARFLSKYGVIALFYMHFIGSLRSVLCFIAGMVDYPTKKFVITAFVSSLFWSIFFSASGFILSRTTQDVKSFQGKVAAAAIGLLIVFCVIKFIEVKVRKLLRS